MSDVRPMNAIGPDALISRKEVLALIESEIERWDDTDPPRWALSALWGRVRDLAKYDVQERAP